MVYTTVYLRPDQYEALRVLVDKTGAPMAYYVREAIDAVLAIHGGRDGEEDDEQGRVEGTAERATAEEGEGA